MNYPTPTEGSGYDRIRRLLAFLYGVDRGSACFEKVRVRLAGCTSGAGRTVIGHGDVLLITYADMLAPAEGAGGAERTALARLTRFLNTWGRDAFTFVHLLPFHPYSSDDGFSVIDYTTVDARVGTWDDIQTLARSFKPVFDLVINHGSVHSAWFRAFLRGEAPYRDWYLTRPADYDWRAVVRPRTHPLLTPFTRADGSVVHVWTTFSADQADYDFSNPEVLLRFIDILLDYAARGARIVRLDAIAYLWKEDGTPCLHHPKTHAVVKLFRAIVDALGLDLLLLTETNVPHEQNVSYFGDADEAHMVYNFALPPLVLHAAISGDAGPLRRWAAALPPADPDRLFLNFLASHDGVGLTPAAGLVDEASFATTIAEAQKRGALVSYKATAGGRIPYELNCSWASVVAPPALGSVTERSRAFLATQAVLLALAGLPAVYFHSWVGSEAWTAGPEQLGYNRAINREKPSVERVEAALGNPDSFRAQVYAGFQRLLAFRRAEPAFAPGSAQRVLAAPDAVFALLRGPDAAGRYALCIQNLAGAPATLSLPTDLGSPEFGVPQLALAPWETRWLALGASRAPEELSL